jgi:hypothetical protein
LVSIAENFDLRERHKGGLAVLRIEELVSYYWLDQIKGSGGNEMLEDAMHSQIQLQNLEVGDRLSDTVKVKIILRPTVSWPVCLGVRHASGTRDQFVFSFFSFNFRFLWVCW